MCGSSPGEITVTSDDYVIKYENAGVLEERTPKKGNPYEACFW